MLFELILQLHGKKSGGSSSAYKPTAEERRLWSLQGDFQEAINPYGINLIQKSSDVLTGSLGEQQYDFRGLDRAAQNRILQAQNGVANLTQGILPSAYQKNMEDSIRSGVQNTMGTSLNSLANRGVLNSSVTNQAMDDISKNVSDTMAQQYSNNIGTLNGLYGQQSQLATQPISAAAAAQEAALSPALSLLNAALGVGSSNTGAVQSLHGTGTTTTTTNNGGGLFNTIMGAGSTIGSALIACFVGDTDIAMSNDKVKKIKDVEVGDNVKTVDPITNEEEVCTVTEVMDSVDADIVGIMTDNGDFVFTTKTQPLLTENDGWVLVDKLSVGTMLKNVGKVHMIVDCGIQKVYDLKVDGCGTYIANGFVAKGGTEEW